MIAFVFAMSLSAVRTFTTSPLRLGEIENEATVEIYPNPNNGEFTIDLSGFNGETTIEIFNVSGQLIYEDNFIADEDLSRSISIKNYHGLALIKITSQQNTLSKSVVIQ